MAIEIPDSAAFYVRGSLNRALQEMRELIENSKKVLADPTNYEALAVSMAQGSMHHWRQWYKESVAEFRQFPESIRPDKDLLDYEI